MSCSTIGLPLAVMPSSKKLVLYLGYGGAFDGGGVGDDRVEIELLIVYLLRYSQLLVFFQNL